MTQFTEIWQCDAQRFDAAVVRKTFPSQQIKTVGKRKLKRQSQFSFPFWQLTVPLCIFGVFSMSCWTAIHLENGSLMIQVELQKGATKVGISIDKKSTYEGGSLNP